jgi:hypothetical protein
MMRFAAGVARIFLSGKTIADEVSAFSNVLLEKLIFLLLEPTYDSKSQVESVLEKSPANDCYTGRMAIIRLAQNNSACQLSTK